ncbi:Tyrosine-protein phosphatase non-receptor type 4 [Taenia solium]|eukprot:TsM_000444500 transcript=TsM_000444500 gene=TsM_000444500
MVPRLFGSSSMLACSFFTYALLAAYWAQSELGDWDLHVVDTCPSPDYLMPLCLAAPLVVASSDDADGGDLGESEERRWSTSRTGAPHPPPLIHLTTSFLQQVAFFHRALRGLIPSRADLLFLQIARKLATYGIDFHRIENSISSTVHVNSTRRLSKRTEIQRSQSLRPKAITRSQNLISLSPSHLPKSRSNNSIPIDDNFQQYPYFLGVFHGGIYIYRGRLRLEYHPWSAIVKMAYRRASFRLCLRLANSEKDGLVRVVRYDCGTTALAKRIYCSCVDHHALFRLHRLEGGERVVSWTSQDSFPFLTSTRLRRLHPTIATVSLSPTSSSAAAVASPLKSVEVCTAASSDARLRPLSEPDVREPHAEIPPPLDRQSSRVFCSAHKFFLRLFRKHSLFSMRRASQLLSTRHLHPPLSGRVLQQVCAHISLYMSTEIDGQRTGLGVLTLAEGFESTSLSAATATSASSSVSPFYTPSEWNRPPLPGPLWRMSPLDATDGLLFEPIGGLTVSRDWRLAACQEEAERMPSTEWRGCRATWGVSESSHSSSTPLSFGPRRLFFENASLILGEDAEGFAYQTSSTLPLLSKGMMSEDWFKVALSGEGEIDSHSHSGSLIIGGASADVIGSSQGDVIGCYLDLDGRLAHWTKNGVTTADMTISIARFPSETVFFPACAIRNSSVTFNFGDTPFAYGPMLLTGENSHSNWLPLGSANLIAEIAGWGSASPTVASHLPIRLAPNPRTGWHLISSNSPGSILSPDGFCVRALLHSSWQLPSDFHKREYIPPVWLNSKIKFDLQTLHASKPIPASMEMAAEKPSHSKSQLPSVYFEVHLLESLTATPGAGVFMGFSTSFSSSPAITSVGPMGWECVDSFGILCEQTSNNQTYLVHAGVKRPYGKGLHRGDIIGCTLNPQIGLVFWSINGEYLGHIVQICVSHSVIGSATADDVITIPLRRDQSSLSFTPLFCLANTSIEVNFGDGSMPLKHINKHTNCIPLCHYQRLLDGCSLTQHLSSSPQPPYPGTQKKEPSPNHRHNSFAHCRTPANQNGNNGHLPPLAPLGVHKSASCLSAPAAATMNLLVPTEILDALTILQSRIPLVPVKTRLWRRDSAEPASHKPITSPTFAAPWSRANQILPIVRTHRIAVSTLPPTAGIMETDIDNDSVLSTAAMAIAVDGSLRRSASDTMHRALVRHLCGQSQQSSASAANQSSSSSLIERRMAQIPLVPTRIVHTLAHANKSSVLCFPFEHEGNTNEAKESVTMTVEAGEETIARQRHVMDLTLPPSIAKDDRHIVSPPLPEVV